MKVEGLRSPRETTGGMVYFPRMIDKIRLFQAGQLPEDYHQNLGRGFDGRCVHFVHVNYNDLCDRVSQGGSDDEILEWCFTHGHKPDEESIQMWNGFLSKIGWRDGAADHLERRKRENGLEGRDDLRTMFDFIDADEGREPVERLV